MRLLNASTYEFHVVLGPKKPKYAILSHTWEDDEVLFEDMRDTAKSEWSAKKGYFKIKKTCAQALQNGCDFVWIDTCNINKDSSTELSEAINSMFRWYRDATICYAYISDTIIGDEDSLSKCRWLTRGWTLQEMIAPDRVHFYDMDWNFLGSRISLARHLLPATTGIHTAVLLRRHRPSIPQSHPPSDLVPNGLVVIKNTGKEDETPLFMATDHDCPCCPCIEEEDVESMLAKFSVAQKMKWASKRTTTREEDMAYCLMGLFDVNMPLLYGEGSKAFFRLQEAIIAISSDQSILAFRSDLVSSPFLGDSPLLAPNPRLFCDEVHNMHMPARGIHTSLTGTTLSIEMLICPVQGDGMHRDQYLGILDCSLDGDPSMRPAILLSPVHAGKFIFRRSPGDVKLFRLRSSHPGEAVLISDDILEPRPLFWSRNRIRYNTSDIKRSRITIIGEKLENHNLRPTAVPIRVNLSSTCLELGCRIISSSHTIGGNLPDTAGSGWVKVSCGFGEDFCVDWKRDWTVLFSSIRMLPQPKDVDVIRDGTSPISDLEHMMPMVFLELESLDTCMTTPLTELHRSKPITLTTTGPGRLEVWISVSRETFIGRSRYELGIHGKISTHDRDKLKDTSQGLVALRSYFEELGLPGHPWAVDDLP